MLEINKDILRIIKSDKKYKEILVSYRNVNKLIKKNPINNYIKIKKNVENIEKQLSELITGKLTQLGKQDNIKIEIEDIDIESLNQLAVKELREICKKYSITGYSKANKSVLVTKLKDKFNSPKLGAENIDQQIEKELQNYIHFQQLNISQWKERFKREFLTNLEDLLKKKKFELKGTLPMLRTSLFSFKIDFEKPFISIWYGPEQERLVNCKLDFKILAETIDKFYNYITNREFNENNFLKKVFRAYEISIFKKGKKYGEQIPIINVLLDYIFLNQNNKFKTNPRKEFYTDYTRFLFSYDLYKLKKRKVQNNELTLMIATRAYTKKYSDFIWVPTNEKGDGNYISHIKFKEINYE